MSDPEKEENPMLTAAEAAERKGVTKQAVYAAIKEGRLPARRFGKSHILLRRDVDAWHVVKHGPKPRKKREPEP
jgi:excisionase family DNA binding protein